MTPDPHANPNRHATEPPLPDRLHLDPHTHLHDCFDPARFLDRAWQNFQRAGAQLGVIGLTERQSEHAFDRLRDQQTAGRGDTAWRIEPIAEAPAVLRAVGPNGQTLGIVQGVQLATAERLEVLVMGSRPAIPDGLPFRETLDTVRQAGLQAVVPWGFGKWTGARARLIQQLIGERPAGVALGDNGGRPTLLPHRLTGHGLLDDARRAGLTVLPGSDPLPIPMAEARAGTLGVVISAPTGWAGLAQTLASLASLPQRSFEVFGRNAGLLRAFAQQAAVRLHKPGSAPHQGVQA